MQKDIVIYGEFIFIKLKTYIYIFISINPFKSYILGL